MPRVPYIKDDECYDGPEDGGTRASYTPGTGSTRLCPVAIRRVSRARVMDCWHTKDGMRTW